MAEEAKYLHDYNQTEHINTRIKSSESLMAKLEKNITTSFLSSKNHIADIAGMRIIYSFVNKIYHIYS
ncbi:MAG TPA: hypothetical protein VNU45_15260 [Rummeliibacillus sp.]|nr:hypothetical protein [Rummeliibacillus sp.]